MQEFHEWFKDFWPVIVFALGISWLLGKAFQRITHLEEESKERRKNMVLSANRIVELEASTKKMLYHDDGTLIYVCKKDCEKEIKSMEAISNKFIKEVEEIAKENKMEYMAKADHEQKCKLATWEMKETVGKMLDTKFAAFEKNLFRQLKLNGFGHSEV